MTRIYASFRDLMDYESILDKNDNTELNKTACRLVSHAALLEYLMKQRGDSHDAREKFETIKMELRALALDLENRVNTSESANKVPLKQIENIFLHYQGGASQRFRGRDLPVGRQKQRGERG